MRTLGTKAAIGYWICVALAVLDVVGLVITPAPAPGEEGPPVEVLWFTAVMGVVTLVAAVVVARSANRVALRVVAASRVLSAITALPAFFVPGVPPEFVVLGAVFVVLTIIAVVLLMSRAPRPVAAA